MHISYLCDINILIILEYCNKKSILAMRLANNRTYSLIDREILEKIVNMKKLFKNKYTKLDRLIRWPFNMTKEEITCSRYTLLCLLSEYSTAKIVLSDEYILEDKSKYVYVLSEDYDNGYCSGDAEISHIIGSGDIELFRLLVEKLYDEMVTDKEFLIQMIRTICDLCNIDMLKILLDKRFDIEIFMPSAIPLIGLSIKYKNILILYPNMRKYIIKFVSLHRYRYILNDIMNCIRECDCPEHIRTLMSYSFNSEDFNRGDINYTAISCLLRPQKYNMFSEAIINGLWNGIHNRDKILSIIVSHGDIKLMDRLLRPPYLFNTYHFSAEMFISSSNNKIRAFKYLYESDYGLTSKYLEKEDFLYKTCMAGDIEMLKVLISPPIFYTKHNIISDGRIIRDLMYRGKFDIYDKIRNVPGINITASDIGRFSYIASNIMVCINKIIKK